MTVNDRDQAQLREYLLGKLSDDDQEKIEERLMVEDDLFEELEISKGELIEEYLEGELPEQERTSFEEGFLSTLEGRRGQTFAVAIDTLERHRVQAQSGLLEKLWAFFRQPQWAIGTVALAAVVIAAIVWVRSPQQASKFVAVTLTSSAVTRANADVQHRRITIPPDTNELRVSLTLPQPATPGTRYRIVLDNRRERTSLQPSGQDANSVSLVIPARQVPAGFYALVIYEIKANGTEQQIPGNYFFLTQ